ncbi:MAG: hypothetical protein AB7I18_01625 [Candidatus Berkiella sp.]
MQNQINDLPVNVQQSLADFVTSAKQYCQDSLISIVLYGSGAEGRLRASSDVNLILVLRSYDIECINPLREKLRLYHAAIQLNVMFILESEIDIAVDAFAVKFTDVLNRHRVLYGTDPFNNIKVSRIATLERLKQVIINLTLRLRERYALVSLREEQLVHVIADVSGPIRSCAAAILNLEGKRETHPKEALAALTQQLGGDWTSLLQNMSRSRQDQELGSGEQAKTVLSLLVLLKAMYDHVQGLA